MTPRARTIIKRTALGLLAMVILLVALIVSLLIYTTTPHFGSTVGSWISDRSGREIVVGEDAEFHLWQRNPRVVLHNITVRNADWSKDQTMFEAKRIEFTFRALPLLKAQLVIPELILESPKLLLEKNEKGEANWHFGENVAGAALAQPMPDKRADIPLIHRLSIIGGELTYRDPTERIDTTLEVSTIRGESDTDENVTIKGKGTFQNQSFILDLSGASILQLREGDQPYPFVLQTSIGPTKVDARGTVSDPIKLEKFDVTLKLQGANAADLFPLTGIALPRTPPYSVNGHLTREGSVWKFSDFTGKMGNSDLGGNLAWHSENKPPYLEAQFVSSNLDVKDLGPLIGADKAPDDETRVLPDMPLDISRMMAMNADISFEGKRVKASQLLEDFSIKAHLQDGTLQLKPISFGIAHGKIDTDVTVEGKASPPVISLRTQFKRLYLSELFEPLAERFGKENVSAGLLGGTVTLKGTGLSLRDMLANANGHAGFGMEGGNVSHLLLELAGLDIFRAAGLLLSGNDKPVPIQCVVAEFDVKAGLMTTRDFLIATDITTIRGTGTVSLRDEVMDLELKTYPKKPTLISARSPLHIRGTFKKPRVGVDTAALILRGSAAAVLGTLLTPAAGMLAFIGPGLSETGGCANFIGSFESTPQPKGDVP